MGLFKKQVTDPDEIARLKAEIASMSARLEASEQAKGELDSTVHGLVRRLETPAPPPPVPRPTVPPVAASEVDKLNAKIERLTARLDAESARSTESAEPAPGVGAAELEQLTERVERIAERIDEVDQRISSISTELANQITELSGDIEAVGGQAPPTDEIVDELRDAQTRLAGEQARYQIAFRQDLAELADRLRRA
jgi:methyl-accepting chemotaxis protein